MTQKLDVALKRVLTAYPAASTSGPLYGDPLTSYISNDLADAVRAHVAPTYKVRASAGQFNTWSHSPFVAVFDRAVTTSAQRGYYVVYLFRRDGGAVYLSLNQATTEVRDEFGKQYLEVLESRAEFGRDLLRSADSAGLIAKALDLGGTSDLSRGYEAGNILAKRYDADGLPPQTDLAGDLQHFLELYSMYKAAYVGQVGTGDDEPDDTTSWEEKKKFRWHRRAERDRKMAQKAKEFHGYRCQVCNFDFQEHYGDRGVEYIEAHHIVPFAALVASPEPAILDYREDFAVVCANCHRMLHRKPLLEPSELRKAMGIEFVDG
jgi:5-methylcytosine-specific restriction protein A